MIARVVGCAEARIVTRASGGTGARGTGTPYLVDWAAQDVASFPIVTGVQPTSI